MWLNKYRPTTFDDIVGNKDIVRRFKATAENKCIQHLILCGPCGSGKSLMVNLLVRTFLGPLSSSGLLRFGSSDERNIQTIREKIHQFVPKKMNSDIPKIVVFEEAEQLGDGVQQMMRRLMEKHAHHAVFLFVCSTLSGLIETIQSRCQIFQLSPVTEPEQVCMLRHIAEQENVEVEDEAMKMIAKISHGDMRVCINYFQTCCAATVVPPESACDEADAATAATAAAAATAPPRRISVKLTTVLNVCLFPHYDILERIFNDLLHSDDGLWRAIQHVKQLHMQGYGGLDIIMFLSNYLQNGTNALEKHNKKLYLALCKEISIGHVRVTQGVDSFLQLCGLLGKMYAHIQQPPY